MSGASAAADKFHPLPESTEVSGAGTVYGATATEADNVFENGGESCVIWGVRCDSATNVTLTILDGPVEAGANVVAVISSTTTVEGHGAFPIQCPNGFHVMTGNVGNWCLSWSPMSKPGA